MKTRNIENLTQPLQFQNTLTNLHNNLWQLFELARENEHVTDCKTAFHVSGQYDRPDEFLQCLLDMVRVMFEPYPLGTFFLNANLDFLTSAISDKSGRLGYLSAISEEGESIESFWESRIATRLDELDYSVRDSTLIAMCSTGPDRYNLDLICEVGDFLEANFSVDDALALMSKEIKQTAQPSRAAYAGYSPDYALGNRLRLSLWLISDKALPASITHPHPQTPPHRSSNGI